MYQYNNNSFCFPEEIVSIIKAVPQVSVHPERDALLIELAWETGGRINEVLTLVPEHVLEKSIVLVNLKQKKTKSGRPPQKIVEVSQDLCDWIKRFCDENKISRGDWVFQAPRDKTKHLRDVRAFEMITRASETAKVFRLGKANVKTGGRYKGISFHVIRHSYATYLLKKEKNMAIVQKQLGHSQIANTQKYASVVFDDVRAAVAKASVNLYHP